MRYQKWVVMAACSALFIVGCKKESASSPADNTGAAAEQMQNSAEKAAGNAQDTADTAADKMKNAAENAKDQASESANKAADAVKNSEIAKDAADKLDQVKDYIKDHKYDLADKTLSQLEDHKASLPQTIQNQLPSVRKMLDSAKSTGGNMPSLGQ